MTGIDEAVLLAGGLGTRLRSVTGPKPKCLAPLAGRTILDWQMDRLAKAGVRRIILSLAYGAADVEAHLASSTPPPLDIAIATERNPAGTAAGLTECLAHIQSDQVLVLNADSIATTPLNCLRQEMLSRLTSNPTTQVVLLCVPVTDARDYGRIEIDEAGNIVQFLEKRQNSGQPLPGLVNAGVYAFRKQAIAAIKTAGEASLEKESFLRLVQCRALAAAVDNHPFYDLGTPARLDFVANQLCLTDLN